MSQIFEILDEVGEAANRQTRNLKEKLQLQGIIAQLTEINKQLQKKLKQAEQHIQYLSLKGIENARKVLEMTIELQRFHLMRSSILEQEESPAEVEEEKKSRSNSQRFRMGFNQQEHLGLTAILQNADHTKVEEKGNRKSKRFNVQSIQKTIQNYLLNFIIEEQQKKNRQLAKEEVNTENFDTYQLELALKNEKIRLNKLVSDFGVSFIKQEGGSTFFRKILAYFGY